MNNHEDIAIIGVGVVGLLTAWHLNAFNPRLKIAMYDRISIGGGSSSRGPGILTRSIHDPSAYSLNFFKDWPINGRANSVFFFNSGVEIVESDSTTTVVDGGYVDVTLLLDQLACSAISNNVTFRIPAIVEQITKTKHGFKLSSRGGCDNFAKIVIVATGGRKIQGVAQNAQFFPARGTWWKSPTAIPECLSRPIKYLQYATYTSPYRNGLWIGCSLPSKASRTLVDSFEFAISENFYLYEHQYRSKIVQTVATTCEKLGIPTASLQMLGVTRWAHDCVEEDVELVRMNDGIVIVEGLCGGGLKIAPELARKAATLTISQFAA